MTRKSKVKRTQKALRPADEGARAAVYLRVSTEEQAAQGYGLDAQRTKCQAMLTLKGWTHAGEYADEGISGTLDESERPALARLLADIHAGQIDAVILAALDRLGRRTQIVLRLVEDITGHGVALLSCKESLDTDSPAGRLMLTIFAAMAEWERETILERTDAGRQERGRKDGERGGRMPMGYRRTGQGIEVDTTRAADVRRIFALRAEGHTLRAIADRLNAAGVPCSQKGSRWEAATVKAVLDNGAAYRGGQRADSPVHWPAILPPPAGAD